MAEFKVDGMKCGHCVASVSKAVRGVPGVQDVAVDLRRGSVKVTGNPDEQAVRAAITDERYQIQPG